MDYIEMLEREKEKSSSMHIRYLEAKAKKQKKDIALLKRLDESTTGLEERVIKRTTLDGNFQVQRYIEATRIKNLVVISTEKRRFEINLQDKVIKYGLKKYINEVITLSKSKK